MTGTESADRDEIFTACRGCGCTDAVACPSGCWWAYDSSEDGGPLCSRCAGVDESVAWELS
jgi:hypothetical protein